MRILFVCRENACRSQIAEAFARAYGGDQVQACSAGSRPRGSVDRGAIAVMAERGISMAPQQSKGVTELPQTVWDVVVGVGCGYACPVVTAKRREDWDVPDPAGHDLATYRAIRDDIDSRVKRLLAGLGLPVRSDGSAQQVSG